MAIHTSTFTASEIDSILGSAKDWCNYIHFTSGSLDSLYDTGNYYAKSTSDAANVTGYPTMVSGHPGFTLYVRPLVGVTSGNRILQFLFVNGSYVVFKRRSNTAHTAWESWEFTSYYKDGIKFSGTTSERPTSDLDAKYHIGFIYFDTTLGKPIFFNGTGWVDATGASV